VNHAVRRAGYVVVALLLVLIGQLTYLQVFDAKKLADDPRNSRGYLRSFNRPRGEIVSADGEILARSTRVDDEYGWQRTYPFEDLFAQTVGYQSVVVGSVGIEKVYDGQLSGRDLPVEPKDLPSILSARPRVGTVVLHLNAQAQAAPPSGCKPP